MKLGTSEEDDAKKELVWCGGKEGHGGFRSNRLKQQWSELSTDFSAFHAFVGWAKKAFHVSRNTIKISAALPWQPAEIFWIFLFLLTENKTKTLLTLRDFLSLSMQTPLENTWWRSRLWSASCITLYCSRSFVKMRLYFIKELFETWYIYSAFLQSRISFFKSKYIDICHHFLQQREKQHVACLWSFGVQAKQTGSFGFIRSGYIFQKTHFKACVLLPWLNSACWIGCLALVWESHTEKCST